MHLDLPTKRYYRIGEIAKAFDVNASLIRFWDKEFEALKPKKNAKGNRRFTTVLGVLSVGSLYMWDALALH